MINNLAKEVHENARNKGFYDAEKNIGEMLCLIHSEVSEALEADRKDRFAKTNIETYSKVCKKSPTSILCGLAEKEYGFSFYEDLFFKSVFVGTVKDTFEDELADIVIRVMDLAAFKNIDLEAHIKAKMRFNSLREHKHGKKY
tara:strand:+ start:553 stop:981 length:429 start_codon:yes stop_codon:yes gene_type:complete